MQPLRRSDESIRARTMPQIIDDQRKYRRWGKGLLIALTVVLALIFGGIEQNTAHNAIAVIKTQDTKLQAATTAMKRELRSHQSELLGIQAAVGDIEKLTKTAATNHNNTLAYDTKVLDLLEAQLGSKARAADRTEVDLLLACIYNRIDHDTIKVALLQQCDVIVAKTG